MGLNLLEFQRIKNVIAFPFIHDGIPILYYGICALGFPLNRVHQQFLGQEQGYTGGNDPFNREA